MTIKPGDQFGPYTIDRSLSKEGGMSQVFLASNSEDRKWKAALKVQLAEGENSATFQDLLHQEVNTLKTLRHPGIVHIYPLHIDGRAAYRARAYNLRNQPWYFAMEYLGEKTLDKQMDKVKKLPLEWGIEFFYQLLLIVDYIHQRGYAHCDLKPQNIFLRQPPDSGVRPMPILVDFGSAVDVDKGIHQLTASLRYSAPEVLTSLERQDIHPGSIQPQKVDIWALGAILFEILTGNPMVSGRRRNVITTTVIRGEFDRIVERRKDNHIALDSLDTVLSKMISHDPQQRPSTQTLIKAIEERIPSIGPPRILAK